MTKELKLRAQIDQFWHTVVGSLTTTTTWDEPLPSILFNLRLIEADLEKLITNLVKEIEENKELYLDS